MGVPLPGVLLPIGGRKFTAAATLMLYPKFLKTTDDVARVIEGSPAVLRNWRSEDGFQILVRSLERHFSEFCLGFFLDCEFLPLWYMSKTEPFLWNNEVLRLLIYNLARLLKDHVKPEKAEATKEGDDPLRKGLGAVRGERLEIGVLPRADIFLAQHPLNLIAAREGLQLLVRSYQGLWGGRDCPQNSDFLDEGLKGYFCDIGLELEKHLSLLEKTYATNNRDEISKIHKNCQILGKIAAQKIAFLDHLAKSKANTREVYSVSESKRPEGRNKKRNG
jgi:hypothetical protein